MPFVKVYIHFVWSTKDRTPLLNSPEIRRKVWEHIKENSIAKKIFIDTINGYQEHCHCLISLGVDQTIKKIVQLIKGESSYWINQSGLCKHKFEWQDEYFGVSVSESMVEKVRSYIKNQEEHHKHISFQGEFDDFIEKCGFLKFKDGSINQLPPPLGGGQP
jgi:putative transposase